jgi:hypothetical protein
MTFYVMVYTVWTFFNAYQYMQLTHRTLVKQIDWSVQEIKKDTFVVQADYTFSVKGSLYKGQTVLDPSYLNDWAAQEAIQKQLAHQSWKVWVDPHHLNNSTLQKKFPTKQCISIVILWILWIYFINLGFYVKQHA